MRLSHRAAAAVLVLLVACSGSEVLPPPAGTVIAVASGDGQTVVAGASATLTVSVADAAGAPLPGIAVGWQVVSGGGSIPAASSTDGNGLTSAQYTAGTTAGVKTVRATIQGLEGQAAAFTLTATAAPAQRVVRTGGDGQSALAGQSLAAPLRVTVVDAFGNGVPGQSVTWTVTAGSAAVAPALPATDGAGAASATVTTQASGQIVVTATATGLSGSPVTFTATATIPVTLAAQVPIPANYGLHDQFIRDGLAFLCAWNTGVMIYDVGNGMRGGSPTNPVLVSSIVTGTAGVPGGAQVHNAWWYHAPSGDKRYVFVGQEGPGSIGSSSAGDIHVVDIANINNPVEVASYHLAGAGTHNFWVDEQAEILYAAYYNGGVVALDISGTLSGDLASREISRLQPGGSANTFVWGVMQYGGAIYASDMLSGLWQLRSVGGTLSVAGGGGNVPERFGSDLWVANGYAYTGTWGTRFTSGTGRAGNTVKVWRLDAAGAPALADSVVLSGIGTVSDVEVSADGRLLVFSTENGPNAGIWFFSLAADPAHPVLLGSYLVSTGVHTATIAEIGGRRYVFASKDPGSPALLVLDVTSLGP